MVFSCGLADRLYNESISTSGPLHKQTQWVGPTGKTLRMSSPVSISMLGGRYVRRQLTGRSVLWPLLVLPTLAGRDPCSAHSRAERNADCPLTQPLADVLSKGLPKRPQVERPPMLSVGFWEVASGLDPPPARGRLLPSRRPATNAPGAVMVQQVGFRSGLSPGTAGVGCNSVQSWVRKLLTIHSVGINIPILVIITNYYRRASVPVRSVSMQLPEIP